jgi:hypothetical protein
VKRWLAAGNPLGKPKDVGHTSVVGTSEARGVGNVASLVCRGRYIVIIGRVTLAGLTALLNFEVVVGRAIEKADFAFSRSGWVVVKDCGNGAHGGYVLAREEIKMKM